MLACVFALLITLATTVSPLWIWDAAHFPDRDKSGTRSVSSEIVDSQQQKSQPFTAVGSFDAERAGFEPAVRFDPYAALAKRCFRPLSHLSGMSAPAK